MYEFESPEQREKLRAILCNINVILRVLSARDVKVDVEMFHQHCLDTYRQLLLLFPWMEISDTMHAIFHAAKLIELNDGYAIGDYSESPLEERSYKFPETNLFLQKSCNIQR